MSAYKAKQLPVQPGISGWNALLPDRIPRPELDQDTSIDVAIIGGGFAGQSAAHRLAELDPSASVAVLEAGLVGNGPAGRNSGFMIDLPHDLASDDYAGSGAEHDKAHIAHNRIAINYAHSLAERLSIPQEAFDPCGKINAAATEAGDKHNQVFGDYLASIGEATTLLSRQEMKALTGIDFYSSGLHAPGTVMLQPAAYIRALADGLPPSVSLYENSPVKLVEKQGQSWVLQTPKGTVTAKRVIMAANGHAESFGLYKRQLMHVFTYASMTRALNEAEVKALGGSNRWSVTPADPMGTSVRRISGTGGERIAIRARFTYDPSMEVTDKRIASVGSMHDGKFDDRFPMLKDVEMEYRWSGHLCLSWNGVPAFGEVDVGMISAICQNGLGTVQGTLGGMAAAEASLDQPGEAMAALAKSEALKKLPPEPLAYIGANGYMRYKEWRAGKE